ALVRWRSPGGLRFLGASGRTERIASVPEPVRLHRLDHRQPVLIREALRRGHDHFAVGCTRFPAIGRWRTERGAGQSCRLARAVAGRTVARARAHAKKRVVWGSRLCISAGRRFTDRGLTECTLTRHRLAERRLTSHRLAERRLTSHRLAERRLTSHRLAERRFAPR